MDNDQAVQQFNITLSIKLLKIIHQPENNLLIVDIGNNKQYFAEFHRLKFLIKQIKTAYENCFGQGQEEMSINYSRLWSFIHSQKGIFSDS